MSKPIGGTKLGQHFTHHRDLPLGTINKQGYKKIEDPETGRTKWVNAKKGLSFDYAGGLTNKRLEPPSQKPPMHTSKG